MFLSTLTQGPTEVSAQGSIGWAALGWQISTTELHEEAPMAAWTVGFAPAPTSWACDEAENMTTDAMATKITKTISPIWRTRTIIIFD